MKKDRLKETVKEALRELIKEEPEEIKGLLENKISGSLLKRICF